MLLLSHPDRLFSAFRIDAFCYMDQQLNHIYLNRLRRLLFVAYASMESTSFFPRIPFKYRTQLHLHIFEL